ncbi:MAG: hypothetical protein INQ03_22145 [Candidatus Heimdallarchaeota archaeon]|nr:hypothetical protein [Candidatus Heimdallarchaeota archaeon]
MSRPENRNPPTTPMVILFCNYCQEESTYRRVAPEDIGAANDKGVDNSLRNLYKKLTTPMSEAEDIRLDFLDE